MPNIKSAKKRVLVNEKKSEQNKSIRSAVKTEIKKVELLIKENKLEDIKSSLSSAFAAIDAACTKNIFHKNNAANKKAKLAKKVDAALKANGVAVTEVPVKEEVVEVKEEVKVEAPVEAPVKKAPAKKTTTTTKKTTTAKKAPAKKAADAE